MLDKDEIVRIEKEVKALRSVFIGDIINENWSYIHKSNGSRSYESKKIQVYISKYEITLIVKIKDTYTKGFTLNRIMSPVLFKILEFLFIKRKLKKNNHYKDISEIADISSEFFKNNKELIREEKLKRILEYA